MSKAKVIPFISKEERLRRKAIARILMNLPNSKNEKESKR